MLKMKIMSIVLLVVMVILLKEKAFAENSNQLQMMRSFIVKIVDSLVVESANGEVKVGVNFDIIFMTGTTASAETVEKIKAQYAELIEAAILAEVKRRGLRDKISVVERRRLFEILNEQKLSAVGLTEKSIASIGGIAGLDIVINGSHLVNSKSSNTYARLIRVKDARLLDTASITIDEDSQK